MDNVEDIIQSLAFLLMQENIVASLGSNLVVRLQENAWCSEPAMHWWVKECWRQACEGRMHLTLDVHRAHKTEAIQKLLKEDCHSDITCVPGQ